MHSFLVSFALISYYNGKILLYTTLWMPAVQFLIDHVGRHGLFFVILTNFHSILSEHKAPDDNVNTRLLLWPVNKSQMSAKLCKYFLSAPKNSPSVERWSEHF